MSKNLIIVESPHKADTIEKFLGPDFRVIASVGHIRKDTKVDRDTFDVTYEVDPEHKKVLSEIAKAVKSSDKVYLATDEDREGEAISWHLTEVLKLPKDTPRITFHEITKPAIDAALKSPRVVDMNMVSSQQARQTLDMIVGFDLSDLVRRKVPGAISAGRVQSPALRLVVEREKKIEKFESSPSFKITGIFAKNSENSQISAQNGPNSTINADFSPNSVPRNINPSQNPDENSEEPDSFEAALEKPLPDEKSARDFLESLKTATFTVSAVESASGSRSAPTPFTTAALQIEANSRLGFSSRTTMSAAQGLYQAGAITYHRTDSLNLSKEAIGQAAHFIEEHFGKKYLHIRHFKTKDASAQEAHEAIRPTSIVREVAGKNDYERKLYNLIRSRTLATQMSNAAVEKTTIKIDPVWAKNAENVPKTAPIWAKNAENVPKTAPVSPLGASKSPASENPADFAFSTTFIAKGEIVTFPGFLKVYGSAKDVNLPQLTSGDSVKSEKITARETFSKPPARYTEGSLVKELEKLGIGRPSTYASIMTAIQARKYVEKGTSEGFERKIREISLVGGAISEKSVSEKTGANKGKLIPTPIGELVAGFLVENFKNIVDYKFTATIEKDLDLVAEAKLDRVKMLRDFYGPFHDSVLAANGVQRYNNARLLGHDPETGKPIYAKVGKNGGFIQLGDNEKESGEKPRFAPLPKRKSVKTVSLDQALKQLALPALPRSLGAAKDGTEIIAANGPFGPYLKCGKYNISVKDMDPYTITFDEALPLYQKKIDSIIADFGDTMIINGVYGPYIKGPGRRNNLKVPKDVDPKTITKDQAEKMLAEKPRTTRRGSRGKRKK